MKPRKARGKTEKETAMGLEREDALGNIKLNDTVFARMLLRAIANTNGKAGLASEKGSSWAA